MKLARGRNVMNVTLVRACATEFRDRRQMFQLFTQIKDSAMQTEDKKIGKVLTVLNKLRMHAKLFKVGSHHTPTLTP